MASGKARSKPAPQPGRRPRPNAPQATRSGQKGRPSGAQGQRSGQRSGQKAKTASPGTSALPLALLGAGLVIGLYAMVPAFYLGGLHVAKNNGIGREVVDHIFPGVLVLLLVVAAIVRRAEPDSFMLAAGVGVLLAGFWMVLTHLGLVSQAFNGQVSKAAALYHCSTAAAVAALGVAWVWQYRAAAEGPADRRPRPPRRRS